MGGGAITPIVRALGARSNSRRIAWIAFARLETNLRALAPNLIAGAYVSESSGVLSAFEEEALWAQWARRSGMR